MSIFSSTNPVDWGQLDGIYIDETSPPPSVTGVPSNTAILVGQFERGAEGMQAVSSVGKLYQLYGNNTGYMGNVALQNKQFGLLKIIRAVASDAVAAAHTFAYSVGPVSMITFSAIWEGAYGNNIQVTIAAGTTQGSKYTVHDANPNAVWPDEVYDNVLITAAATAFVNSNLIVATVIATSHEPSVAAATNLSSGSDGTIADSDYLAAIAKSQIGGAGNILFLDVYNTTRNGYLKTSMAATTDKMAIMAGASGDSVATAVTAAGNLRDTDGRLVYSYPWIYTTIAGVSTEVSPASFYASLLSQIAPNIDPAYAANTQYLAGIEALALDLQRSDYIALAAAGISAFEIDADIGPKVKSGVVTQIVNSAKIMVFRRRMADYLVQSLGKFLKNYENAPNSADARTQAGGGIASFNRQLELSGMVPKDSEVQGGKASIVDTISLNTDDSVADGYFKILYRRRIYSSMRYIVLQAEIGESVVVTEAAG